MNFDWQDLREGDHLRFSAPASASLRTDLTYTVIARNFDTGTAVLTAQCVDGPPHGREVRDIEAHLDPRTAQRCGVRRVHPWATLAQDFPQTFRLGTSRGKAVLRVRVEGEDGRVNISTVARLGMDGEAAFTPNGDRLTHWLLRGVAQRFDWPLTIQDHAGQTGVSLWVWGSFGDARVSVGAGNCGEHDTQLLARALCLAAELSRADQGGVLSPDEDGPQGKVWTHGRGVGHADWERYWNTPYRDGAWGGGKREALGLQRRRSRSAVRGR